MITPKTKIIIVGGGAGGLELATKLGHKLGRKNKADIILVDRNKSHLWKPLLHEVAAGAIDDCVDALSYLSHAKNHYFNFQLGSLTDIDREHKTITLAAIHDHKGKLLVPERQLKFDILVMALGSVSNDFGIVGVKEHCLFLDNPQQAHRLYHEMFNLFLSYRHKLPYDNKIKIAIVGGGATGVELAAELYNAIEQFISYGFEGLDKQALQVTLLEAGERILPALPMQISTAAHHELTKLGVMVLTNTMITSADNSGFNTQSGDKIHANIMVWAAGIKAPDFLQQIGGLATNRINQLLVQSTLQTTLDNSIFAIGDCASCPQKNGGFVPPRAQAAHQMATLCYKNILSLLEDHALKEYVYQDHGALVSLSRFSSIGHIMVHLINSNIIIKGWVARIVYLSLYRMHHIALHGYIKTGLMMLVSLINRIIRPRFKLH